MMKTILVVEDSGSSRDLTAHFLHQGGFRVLEAEDGEQALDILAKRSVELILADIMMPNMDGWAFYNEVRKQKQYNLTPFVFLSSLDNLDDQIKGLTLGVDDYITKPVTPQQLIARVSTALMRGERLKNYFYRDPVSDLETPGYFRHVLALEAERCRNHARPLSLVMVDIGNYVSLARGQADWFAQAAVMESGGTIRQQLRGFDLCADLDQGRFAILMPEQDEDAAKAWAKALRGGWKVGLVWPETEQRIGVDIGFTVDAIAPGDTDPLKVLDKRLESFVRKW
jgi:PleD family two-component response regulator